MSKKVNILIVLAVVLLVVIIGYVAVMNYNERISSEGDEDDVIMLVDLQSKNVLSVKYTYGDETHTVTATDSAYYLDNDKTFPLDQTKAGYMAAAMAAIGCDRFVEDSADNFAEYGLDDPQYVLSAVYDDGTEITLNIGDYNSFTGSNYLNVGGTNKVYLVNPALLDYFSYKKFDLIVLDTVDDIDSSAVTSIVLDRRGEGEITLAYNTEDGWTRTFDGEATEFDAEYANEIFTAAAGIDLTNCVAYSVDTDGELAEYGFDDPTVSVKINYTETVSVTASDSSSSIDTYVDHTFGLLVGDRIEDSELYYVKLTSSKLVCTVPAADIECLITDAALEPAETTGADAE